MRSRPDAFLVSLILAVALLVGCAQPATPTASPAAPTTAATSAAAPTTAPAAASPAASTPAQAAAPTTAPAATSAPVTATTASAATSAPAATKPAAAPASTPGQTQAPASVGFPVTVTDDLGRSVTFDKPPQRIVSLTPGHTETLYALGVGDRVVVTDKYSDYPPENKPKATMDTYPKPNAEELVSLKPDLIVTLVEGDELVQQMEPHGIKVLKLFPKTFDAAVADVELLGKVTGTEPRARQIADGMRERAAAVVAKTKAAPKPRVLYELDASEAAKPFVAGPGGFYGDLIPMAGGKNVFDDLKGDSGQVSSEQIVARDPEYIILGDADSPYNAQTPEMVKARPGWAAITAVRMGRIYPLDQALVSRPGPRLAEGLERMARLLHPELFP